MLKRPFDIDLALERIREAVKPFPQAALFALRDEGYDSLFEQLVACVVSVRTRDETTLVVARRLFGHARRPAEVLSLEPAFLLKQIQGTTFAEPKALTIREIARRASSDKGGLPATLNGLMSLPGVGPKCASLALGVACAVPAISVDVHVHRIVNRWGYIHAKTPEKTWKGLQEVLPRRWWIELNRLLVPFGKHVCTTTLPRCSTCPVVEMCRQVGVKAYR